MDTESTPLLRGVQIAASNRHLDRSVTSAPRRTVSAGGGFDAGRSREVTTA